MVNCYPLLVDTRSMTSNTTPLHITTASAEIAQAFDIVGALHLLPGGEGRTYRAGDIIYRREANIVEASYLADVYHSLHGDGFRIPKPIRTKQGSWISSTGWSAWTFVPGRPALQADLPSVIVAVRAFHQALAHLPYPDYLATRDTLYDRADNAAWNTPPAAIAPELLPLVAELLRLRQPVAPLRPQLIHGDLNEENILVAPGVPPALIDLTPYWHPPEFALAVLAYWFGPYRGDKNVLSAFAEVQEFDQMLVRAALRTLLISQEFGKRSGNLEAVTAEYRPSVAIIAAWMSERERR
jgi:uncharacterized protein (TIGR02569 family)